ncbi:MAG: hypothetical protein NXY57DRAFT_522728 [Lentinula lateritia]|nr:MAG: hypothetical protein NXY57DRAFT_522728 [Lentinula lateritia]
MCQRLPGPDKVRRAVEFSMYCTTYVIWSVIILTTHMYSVPSYSALRNPLLVRIFHDVFICIYVYIYSSGSQSSVLSAQCSLQLISLAMPKASVSSVYCFHGSGYQVFAAEALSRITTLRGPGYGVRMGACGS